MQVLVYLRRMIHPRYVNELCFTAELIDAQRAREMGIANEVVPAAQLDERVEAMVRRISVGSPVAIQRGRYAIQAMEWMGFTFVLPAVGDYIDVAVIWSLVDGKPWIRKDMKDKYL